MGIIFLPIFQSVVTFCGKKPVISDNRSFKVLYCISLCILTFNISFFFLILGHNITYTLSRIGREQMIIDGYKFSCHYKRSEKERWQCTRRSQFGCKASVRKCGHFIVFVNNNHNHSWNRRWFLYVTFRKVGNFLTVKTETQIKSF